MPRHPWREPQEDDLHVAAASLRLVGGIVLLAVTPVASAVVVRHHASARFLRDDELWEFARLLAPVALGGAAFLVLAHFVRRRQFWAGALASWLTLLAVTLAGLGTAMLLFDMIGPPTQWWMLVPSVVGLLLVFALGQLTYHLVKTLGTMRTLGEEARGTRGFEAIVAERSVTPTPAPPAHAPPLPAPPTTAGPPATAAPVADADST